MEDSDSVLLTGPSPLVSGLIKTLGVDHGATETSSE